MKHPLYEALMYNVTEHLQRCFRLKTTLHNTPPPWFLPIPTTDLAERLHASSIALAPWPQKPLIETGVKQSLFANLRLIIALCLWFLLPHATLPAAQPPGALSKRSRWPHAWDGPWVKLSPESKQGFWKHTWGIDGVMDGFTTGCCNNSCVVPMCG